MYSSTYIDFDNFSDINHVFYSNRFEHRQHQY